MTKRLFILLLSNVFINEMKPKLMFAIDIIANTFELNEKFNGNNSLLAMKCLLNTFVAEDKGTEENM